MLSSIQETHALKGEAEHLRQQYASRWGFTRSQLPHKISFWSETAKRTGGVAILLNPYAGGCIQAPGARSAGPKISLL